MGEYWHLLDMDASGMICKYTPCTFSLGYILSCSRHRLTGRTWYALPRFKIEYLSSHLHKLGYSSVCTLLDTHPRATLLRV